MLLYLRKLLTVKILENCYMDTVLFKNDDNCLFIILNQSSLTIDRNYRQK